MSDRFDHCIVGILAWKSSWSYEDSENPLATDDKDVILFGFTMSC